MSQIPSQKEIDAKNLGDTLELIEALGCTEQIRRGAEPQAAMLSTIRSMKEEANDSDRLRDSMSRILTNTANVLKGKPEPLHMHSWHDLAEVATQLRSRLDEVEKEREEAEKELDGANMVIESGQEAITHLRAQLDQLRLSNERMLEQWRTVHGLALSGGSDEADMDRQLDRIRAIAYSILWPKLKNPPESGSEVRG